MPPEQTENEKPEPRFAWLLDNPLWIAIALAWAAILIWVLVLD